MRIAIAYDCLFPWTTGGAQKLYTVMAEQIAADGHEVDYVTLVQWDEDNAPHENFTVVPVATTEIYDDRGVRRVAASLVFAAALFRYFLRNRGTYDAVYASALPSLNVFAIRAALVGRRIPVVFDWPEIWSYAQTVGYSGRAVGTIAFILQRIAIALTPQATVYSPLSVRNWTNRGGRGVPTILGMIEDDLVSDPRFEAPSDPYALYVGRHIPDKQVQSIPAAIVAARRTIPGLRAVILGDGPARSVVEEAIREAGASDFIELPGFVETEQLSDFLAGAAVLVHPSRREGYGMVVVEAAARATPAVVVLGEENAAADLVTDGVNGYRSATSKPDDLSRAIVAAVAGGRQLRQSTATWFAAAYAEGTMVTSARRVLELIERARRVPRA